MKQGTVCESRAVDGAPTTPSHRFRPDTCAAWVVARSIAFPVCGIVVIISASSSLQENGVFFLLDLSVSRLLYERLSLTAHPCFFSARVSPKLFPFM